MRPSIAALLAWLLVAAPQHARSDVQTITQELSANISPAGTLSLPGNVNLSSSSLHFGAYQGSLLVNYWARTADGGSGAIVVQANSEFSPAGGPSIASLTYGCTAATLGTACSGTQTIQTSSQTAVVALPGGICTGGGASCSTGEPNTVQLEFHLPNKPSYKTGSYSVQLTFTITTL